MNEQQNILNNNQHNGTPPRFNVNNNQIPQISPSYNNAYGTYMMNNYQYPQQQSQNYFFKCRPVSSKEEAKACQIDLDGSLWIFTDQSHGKIYTKQILNDGSSAFKVYVYQQEEANESGDDYVTKNDLAKTVEYIMSLIPQQTINNNSMENNKTTSTNF